MERHWLRVCGDAPARMMMSATVMLALLAVVTAGSIERRFGVPIEASDACDPEIGNATYVADSTDCQVFYICDHGWPKMTMCPGNTVWSQTDRRTGQCEPAERAVNDECGHVRPTPDSGGAGGAQDPAYSRCEFKCVSSPECIAWAAKCDTVQHCSDGSDEVNCARPCDERNCHLPDCRCAGTGIPGDLLAREIPQLVVMTWEAAVRTEDYNHLLAQIRMRLTEDRRREPRLNPNGCPISATLFVNHQFTNYQAVQQLYKVGWEIAAGSISNSGPTSYWQNASADLWAREFADQRIILSMLANVPQQEVLGMRAPNLQGGGDAQFTMMRNYGFLYDMSMPTGQNDPPLWPYTLDYRSTQECVIPPCPTASAPALWEMPLVDWLDANGTLCAQVDNCLFPRSKDESLELLRSNFRRHYESNRAPFGLNLRARWFYEGYYNMEAIQEFLDELGLLGDVYVVTAAQALAWLRKPAPLSSLAGHEALACDYTLRPPTCERGIMCAYFNVTQAPNSIDHPGDRFTETCARFCPETYPWLYNPEGRAGR